MSRTQRTMKTAAYSVFTRMITLLVSFAARTVFIKTIGTTDLGVGGLYSEIIRILSFTELGFGTAMTFAMYKPVAEHDQRAVHRLLRFNRFVNLAVASLIAVLGLCILPLLPYIVRGADLLSLSELRIYFLIFVFNTAVSYLSTYKFLYLNALQRPYILNILSTVIRVMTSLCQIIVLLLTGNFLFYLLTEAGILLLSRVGLSMYFRKKWPELTHLGKDNITSEERKSIIRDVRGLIVHRLSSIAVHSTDNLLISIIRLLCA